VGTDIFKYGKFITECMPKLYFTRTIQNPPLKFTCACLQLSSSGPVTFISVTGGIEGESKRVKVEFSKLELICKHLVQTQKLLYALQTDESLKAKEWGTREREREDTCIQLLQNWLWQWVYTGALRDTDTCMLRMTDALLSTELDREKQHTLIPILCLWKQ
jgi:hypothetical protein